MDPGAAGHDTQGEQLMGDYTEHLISMAGGDGDELEEFRSDMKSIRSTLRLAKEHLALLALVREQAEQIDRVKALAEKWRYKGEFGWGAWQEGHGPDPEGYVLDTCSSEIRTVLTAMEGAA